MYEVPSPGYGVPYLFLAFGQYADTPREATLVIRMTGVRLSERKFIEKV